MPNFTRRTWNPASSKTVVGILGDSIAGYYSDQVTDGIDRANGYIYQLLRYYRDRGFNIELHDRAINGGYSYNSAPTGYAIPQYVLDSGTPSRPGVNTSRNIDALIALGCTDIIWGMTNNDVLSSYTEPNPSGFNNATDEQYDILKAVKVLCDANNIALHVFTQNSRQVSTAPVVTYKLISDDLQGTGEFNMFNNFIVLSDPSNSNLGKAGYYLNDVHPNETGNSAVFNALYAYINEQYGLINPLTLSNIVTNGGDIVRNNGVIVVDTP